MKIKAIMLGLVVSGSLLLANVNQGLGDSDAIQRQIDNMNFNPLDPQLIREMTKALVRLDNNVRMNANNIHTLDEATYKIGRQLQAEFEVLKQEVAKLKKAKK